MMLAVDHRGALVEKGLKSVRQQLPSDHEVIFIFFKFTNSSQEYTAVAYRFVDCFW